MDFKIEKYLLKKAEELAFITIKHGGEFKLKSYDVPKGGLDVPIKNEVLVKGIKEKTAQDKLNSMSIADAMIYIIGIDSKFKNNGEYEKFLNALSEDINLDLKAYMGYMSRKYFEIGEHTDALIYIKAFITMYPDDLDAMYNYAIVCQEIAKQYQKDMDEKAMNAFLLEAMAKLEKIIDVDESFALGYYHLGYHYYNQGQYLKTKLTWEDALRLGLDADLVAEIQDNLGKMDFKVQYEEGYTLVFQGKFKEGLEKLLPLEEEHMDWWNLLFMIALGYKGMGEIEQAEMYLEKILIIKPEQVDAIVELGLCEAYKNNLDKAIEYFEQAAKIKEDPEILCNLGMAYLNNGDIDDATYYIERAYELNPQDEITIACLKELGINK
ncbi:MULTISPECIES: tetratricopeptide repeat protein [unclassified Clostridioides]|uniref:tetratricopeptide repeat protein n=1 Tax=unclassified Clostridioides TaxID=2635829 RepID=UPI0007BB9E44|nr:tetratricopeptide repeat protein [Clostridioides sp. ZZV14-6387]MCI9977052.1 tetratricopeptide repeat protein [Clostridioides difficile]MDI0267387.1 tetratricopeptide repeat protein [Clostridioides difficile]MDI7816236.1 tetratricopeptide repeat protein [Clostridioides difficile]CZR96083.1 photosystem I assembly protein Ycf3 [Clostridioides difficile]